MRQISPGATRLCDIHDRVENLLPLITWGPTQAAPLWQKLSDNCPFPVAHVAVVLLSVLHPKLCSKPFALVQAFSLTFFTGSKGLEEENSRLKRLVADQAVQIHILKEVNAKKW
jgi:hypothetical protein